MKLYKPNYNECTGEQKLLIKESKPNDAIAKVRNTSLSAIYKRNQWFKLSCNGIHIYRIIRGSSVKDLTKDKLWISYDSELELGLYGCHDCKIDIVKATLFEQYILAPWHTPNIVERNLFRISTLVGIVSLLLGFSSLLISLKS